MLKTQVEVFGVNEVRSFESFSLSLYMNPFDGMTQNGVYPCMVQAAIGQIEVEVAIPQQPNWQRVAILGHPHSLHGGSMQNKVVTTMLRAYQDKQIPVIRSNFRGVGLSQGVYDAGIGESQDVLLLATLWKNLFPNVWIDFAGFSFGSFVTYRAAALAAQRSWSIGHLISIAPSVEHYNYNEFFFDSNRWDIIHGTADEIAPVEAVKRFALEKSPPIALHLFEQATHFFHGKLIDLREHLKVLIEAHNPIYGQK